MITSGVQQDELDRLEERQCVNNPAQTGSGNAAGGLGAAQIALLVAAAQRGDKRAYGELVLHCWSGVVSVVYRMCGNLPLAEEAAQEAFLRAWQHLPTYRPEHSFRAWVYRIAINAALDELRKGKHTTDLDDAEREDRPAGPALVAAEDPEAELVSKQRAERVQRAVLALPQASRSVLVLREYGELSYAEIAHALNIPIGTVMSRLNSARSQLRQALAGQLEVL